LDGADILVKIFIAVGEDAERGKFLGHPGDVGGRIVSVNGREGDDSAGDFSSDFAGNGDAGFFDALYNGDHGAPDLS
jgi:hypothetical protein